MVLSQVTQLIAKEAHRRGIKITSFEEINKNVLLLEQGGRREFLYQSQTNRLGRVTARLFTDNKYLTTFLLQEGGFPVPEEILTNDILEAERFLERFNKVVLKPLSNSGGDGVTPNVTSREELEEAIEYAVVRNDIKDEAGRYICQEHVEGEDYRVLVFDGKKIFAVQRIPAHVIGDGIRTISELVEARNKTVREPYHIKVNWRAEKLLVEQGLSVDDKPDKGKRIVLSPVANAHSGGKVCDITEEIGQEAAEMSLEIARYFSCSLVGIDIISPDIRYDRGVVIELNACPDISLHHFPDVGKPRNAAGAILDMLFSDDEREVK